MYLLLRPALQTTPEPDASEPQIRDDEGVAISKEELEESINKAVVCTHASFFGAIGA